MCLVSTHTHFFITSKLFTIKINRRDQLVKRADNKNGKVDKFAQMRKVFTVPVLGRWVVIKLLRDKEKSFEVTWSVLPSPCAARIHGISVPQLTACTSKGSTDSCSVPEFIPP